MELFDKLVFKIHELCKRGPDLYAFGRNSTFMGNRIDEILAPDTSEP